MSNTTALISFGGWGDWYHSQHHHGCHHNLRFLFYFTNLPSTTNFFPLHFFKKICFAGITQRSGLLTQLRQWNMALELKSVLFDLSHTLNDSLNLWRKRYCSSGFLSNYLAKCSLSLSLCSLCPWCIKLHNFPENIAQLNFAVGNDTYTEFCRLLNCYECFYAHRWSRNAIITKSNKMYTLCIHYLEMYKYHLNIIYIIHKMENKFTWPRNAYYINCLKVHVYIYPYFPSMLDLYISLKW